MNKQNLEQRRAALDMQQRALAIPNEIARNMEAASIMIGCISGTAQHAPEIPREFVELKIEIRAPSGMIYQIHEVGQSIGWRQPDTRFSSAVLPALRDYLAKLEKEFEALP